MDTERTSLRVAGLMVLWGLGCGGAPPAHRCPPSVAPPPPAPPSAAPADAETPSPASITATDDAAPPFDVQAGACDTSWLPAGTVTAASPADAAALVAAVRAWGQGSRVDVAADPAGLVRIEAEDDEFQEDPRLVGHHSQLLCTPESSWFLAALEDAAQGRAVDCTANVCCWQGDSEGDAAVLLVFRKADTEDAPAAWLLRAATATGEAAIGPEELAATRQWASRALARLAPRRCAPR